MTILLIALTALLWGLWGNTHLADRKWRFELYAYDFAAGALLMVLLLAFTVGNASTPNSFTFEDNMVVASKRNMGIGLAGGVIFCLGNLMILGGATVAGLSTALPVGAAMALLAAIAAATIGGTPANLGLVLGGAGAALAAVVVSALAQQAAAKATPVKKGLHPGYKGFALSLVGGLIAGMGVPVTEMSRGGDIGLGSYGAAVFMTVGMLLMTPLVTLYFLNLPVQGAAGSPLGYLKGTGKQHGLGLAGGALWGAGTFVFFAAAAGAYPFAPRFLGLEALAYGGGVAGGLSGLVLWGEQKGVPRARQMLLATMVLLGAGVAMTFLGA